MTSDSAPNAATELDLRDRIAMIIRKDVREGVSAASTADAVLSEVGAEADKKCSDEDCGRRLPHGRLSAHMWKHAPSPPFSHVLFAWTCFLCGHRKGHRIHDRRQDGS